MIAENYETLLHWVREREAVRMRKESGDPAPWTADLIIGKYRFCNVRREDDRVTIWIRKHIRAPFFDHPNLWFMLAIARWINWPETLAEMVGSVEPGHAWPNDLDFTLDSLAEVMRRRADRGEKVFTGAYTINAPATKGASKIDYVANVVLGEPWKSRAKISDVLAGRFTPANLRAVHATLSKFQGWGPFMAYQVVVDMRFTRLLSGADDIATWAAAGPGTIRGLNRLAGRRIDYPLEQYRALEEMRTLYATVPQDSGVAMDFSDVPNILCETDKYLRVRNGEGAPRALYIPVRGA